MSSLTSRVDHLVFAVDDLNQAIDDFEFATGVRPTIGGKHQGLGTHNAIVSLGKDCYLELIAVDNEQKLEDGRKRFFGLDDNLQFNSLITWALRVHNFGFLNINNSGLIGDITQGSRTLPSGSVLQWKLSMPKNPLPFDGLFPFLIDWEPTSTHPSNTDSQGLCSLVSLSFQHPQPKLFTESLKTIGIEEPIPVTESDRTLMIATLQTPKGLIELCGSAREISPDVGKLYFQRITDPKDFVWLNKNYEKIDFQPSIFERDDAIIVIKNAKRIGQGRLVKSSRPNTYELDGIYVDDRFRNLGVARKIVDYLANVIAQNADLWIIPFEHLAGFYKSCGFDLLDGADLERRSIPDEVRSKLAACHTKYKTILPVLHRSPPEK